MKKSKQPRSTAWRLCLLGLLITPTFARADQDWKQELTKALSAIQQEKFKPAYSDALFFGASKAVEMNSFPEDSAVCALKLWIMRDEKQLLIAWFKQENRAVRVVLASLSICPISDIANNEKKMLEQHSRRFARPEASQRLEEIAHVVEHRQELATTVFQALRGAVDASLIEGFRLASEK